MKMKDKKGTEFEKALYNSLEEMKAEFEVLTNAYKLQENTIDKQQELIIKMRYNIEEIQKDLELRPMRYGMSNTRKLARDAFNQSTTKANWASLEDHPVIKNIYASMIDIRKEEHNDFVRLEQRLDQAQPANEVFKELKNTRIIKDICIEIASLVNDYQGIIDTAEKDRHHANQHALKLRDKMADLETCQNGFEFLLAETNDMFVNGFMFSIGAFATLGYENVAEGLREIIKKPKEEKKKDAPPS